MSESSPRHAPLLAFGAMLLLYSALMPSGLRGADSAEFATLMGAAGVAHPPGYPLYTMLLRAFSWLPFEEMAQAAAFVTMLCGAATCGLLAAIGGALRAGTAASVLVACVIGTELHVLAMHTHPEVFALNNLIAAAIIYVSVREFAHEERRFVLLTLLAGLGLSNHHSIVLLAPIGLFAAWRAYSATDRKLRALGLGAVAFVIGLLPYVYLFSTWSPCDSCLSWGDGGSLMALWEHFTRAAYGTTSLAVKGDANAGDQVATFLHATMYDGFMLIPCLAGYGAIQAWRTRRSLVVAVLASYMLAGPVFIALFNIDLTPIGSAIVGRFYALPIIVCAPLVAFGLAGLSRRWLWAVLLWALLPGALNVETVVRSDGTTIDDYVLDTLEPLPPDAIVLSTGDHRYFGAAYMQQVRNVRTDVAWVDAKLLAYPWYTDRISRVLHAELPRSTATTIPLQEIVQSVMATGRPVFVTHIFADSLRAFPSYPLGTTIRLVAPGERPPNPRELAAQNAAFMESMHFDPLVMISDPWAADLVDSYQQPWKSLEGALRATGDEDGSKRAREIAELLGNSRTRL